MHRTLLSLLFASCITTCYAQYNFAGVYECEGFDPYLKRHYTGVIVIKPQNTVYKLTMAYNTGEEAKGTGGLYDDDTIAVVFQDSRDARKVGLERYSLSEDQKYIQGYWVYLGQDKLGTEICKKLEKNQ